MLINFILFIKYYNSSNYNREDLNENIESDTSISSFNNFIEEKPHRRFRKVCKQKPDLI